MNDERSENAACVLSDTLWDARAVIQVSLRAWRCASVPGVASSGCGSTSFWCRVMFLALGVGSLFFLPRVCFAFSCVCWAPGPCRGVGFLALGPVFPRIYRVMDPRPYD